MFSKKPTLMDTKNSPEGEFQSEDKYHGHNKSDATTDYFV